MTKKEDNGRRQEMMITISYLTNDCTRSINLAHPLTNCFFLLFSYWSACRKLSSSDEPINSHSTSCTSYPETRPASTNDVTASMGNDGACVQTAAARRAFQKPSHRNGTYAGSKADFNACLLDQFGCSNNNKMIVTLTVPYGHNSDKQTNKNSSQANERTGSLSYRPSQRQEHYRANYWTAFGVRGGPSSFQKLTKWGSPRFAVDEDTKCSANTEPFSLPLACRETPGFRDGGACRGSLNGLRLNPLKPTGTRKTFVASWNGIANGQGRGMPARPAVEMRCFFVVGPASGRLERVCLLSFRLPIQSNGAVQLIISCLVF